MDRDAAARAAAAAVDVVLDQMPEPGAKPNPADVLAAQVALHAASSVGATAEDIAAHRRPR